MNYETQFELMEKNNQKYFDLFEKQMRKEGLSEKTIKRHLINSKFYVNDFINHYEVYDMKKGCYELDTYFGPYYKNLRPDFTPYTLNENIASIKKFYKTMHKYNFISDDDYKELIDTIRMCKDEWQEICMEEFGYETLIR